MARHKTGQLEMGSCATTGQVIVNFSHLHQTKQNDPYPGPSRNINTKSKQTHLEKLETRLQSLKNSREDAETNLNLLEKILGCQEELNKKFKERPQDGENAEGTVSSADVNELRKDLRSHRKTKQTYLNKVSEIAGARLKSNNPAIADLSDTDRPSKLAEKFSELYDNEWTDSVEELTPLMQKNNRNMDEEKADEIVIGILCSIVINTFLWCEDKGRKQFSRFLRTALMYEAEEEIPEKTLPAEVVKRCKEYLRAQYEENVIIVKENVKTTIVGEELSKHNLTDWKTNPGAYRHLISFCDVCASLCWLMVLQDPPVWMVWEESRTDIYRPYTRTGNYVDYIVWPSLLLHKGGPVLYKGVAQFTKKEKKLGNSKTDKHNMISNVENECPLIQV